MADDAKIEDTKLSDHDVFTQTRTSDHNYIKLWQYLPQLRCLTNVYKRRNPHYLLNNPSVT